MNTYNVFFKQTDGSFGTATIEAMDAGSAFAKCLRNNPHCILTGAESGTLSKSGVIRYAVPPVQGMSVKDPKPARALKPNQSGCEMPFYDEVKGRGRLS
jgi:hypothetical protein